MQQDEIAAMRQRKADKKREPCLRLVEFDEETGRVIRVLEGQVILDPPNEPHSGPGTV